MASHTLAYAKRIWNLPHRLLQEMALFARDDSPSTLDRVKDVVMQRRAEYRRFGRTFEDICSWQALRSQRRQHGSYPQGSSGWCFDTSAVLKSGAVPIMEAHACVPSETNDHIVPRTTRHRWWHGRAIEVPQKGAVCLLRMNVWSLATSFHQWCDINARQVDKNLPVLRARHLDDRTAKLLACEDTIPYSMPPETPFVDFGNWSASLLLHYLIDIAPNANSGMCALFHAHTRWSGCGWLRPQMAASLHRTWHLPLLLCSNESRGTPRL